MAGSIELVSNTAEQQLVELINKIQILENDPTFNTNNRDYVSGTYNSNTGIFSAQINIPCSINVDATTGITGYKADAYLSSGAALT